MSLAVFDAQLDAALDHPVARRAPAPTAQSSTGLTPSEEQDCKKLGVDPKDYARHKARVMGIQETPANG
jgi:hypothetical protein